MHARHVRNRNGTAAQEIKRHAGERVTPPWLIQYVYVAVNVYRRPSASW